MTSDTNQTFKWNPYQQQECIQFFWPLTEQIPLELDYTGCAREITYSLPDTGLTLQTFPTTNGSIGTNWVAMNISPEKLIVDVESVCFKQRKKPNIIRRLIYKIIGINWELK